MQSRKSTRLLWLAVILILSLSCTIETGSASTAMPQPTAVPPTAFPPTATTVPTITPTKGPVIVDDDFSTDSGRFKCDACVVRDGALFVGPFPAIDSWQPFVAICSDCETASNYKMSVDTWYVEGRSDRGYGLLLRENDETQLLLAISTWQVYDVFSFDRLVGGGAGYRSLMGGWGEGGLKAGRATNSMEAVVQTSNGKTTVSISINGKLRRVVDIPAGSGPVGLWVGIYSLGAGFDNFHFEPLP